jgi:thiol-disulfide isomerase/thioredoxin
MARQPGATFYTRKFHMQTRLIQKWLHHWRDNWKSHLLNVVVLGVALMGVQAWQTRHVPGGAAPDLPMDVVLPDGVTHTTTLTKWRLAHPGQPVALHFWAAWCPICRTEESSITRLAADGPVLTVAMQSGTPQKVQQLLRQRQLSWPTAADADGKITRTFGFQAVPAFVVVDAQGQLRGPTVGYTTELGMRLRLWWATLTTASRAPDSDSARSASTLGGSPPRLAAGRLNPKLGFGQVAGRGLQHGLFTVSRTAD